MIAFSKGKAKKAKKSGLEKLAKYAIDQFGYPYDKDDIARIAARILASKVPFSYKERERIQTDREFICSEYVAKCYEAMSLKVGSSGIVGGNFIG